LTDNSPRDKRVFYDLGQWYKNNDLPDKAIDEFNKVLELDPAFGRLIMNLPISILRKVNLQ